ncbi:hypothetical protein PsYK624_045510 [Phanerochaete sordida]|uniref:Uncharacterized protein n=1 Tax=Phanerochaete sordida TaxID=48140 RepID=A0A9P3LBU7_9APHY|nr:hypothetical protein PsYK624_045510 [Phanerochaete sordida]
MPVLETILSSGLLAQFTRLQQLKTDTPSPENESPAPPRVALALPALLRPLANLSAVHLKSRSLHSCAQLLALIDALPSLQYLTLEGVRIPRSGPVRADRVAAARAKLRTFSWTGLHERPAVSLVTMFAVRLCTADDVAATFFDRLCCTLREVDRHSVNPWDLGSSWGELTCFYKNGGVQAGGEYSVCLQQRSVQTNFTCSVTLSRVPPPADAPAPQTSLLAVLTGAQHPFPVRYEVDVSSALRELDTYATPGYPFTVKLAGEDLEDQVADIQKQLPQLMSRAHSARLVTVM